MSNCWSGRRELQAIRRHAVFLNNAPIAEKSKIQKATTLSEKEAELTSGTDYAQDILFAMPVLESIELRVKKPIMLYIDNKRAVDYARNLMVSSTHIANADNIENR
jgi:hypothetical protein